MTNRLNVKLKHWSSWLVMLFCVVALMIFGTERDSGPATPQERIESISKRLACPTCDGESVYESRGGASQAIRKEIARQVSDGQLTDSQINGLFKNGLTDYFKDKERVRWMILILHKITNSILSSCRSKVECQHFICYCDDIA